MVEEGKNRPIILIGTWQAPGFGESISNSGIIIGLYALRNLRIPCESLSDLLKSSFSSGFFEKPALPSTPSQACNLLLEALDDRIQPLLRQIYLLLPCPLLAGWLLNRTPLLPGAALFLRFSIPALPDTAPLTFSPLKPRR